MNPRFSTWTRILDLPDLIFIICMFNFTGPCQEDWVFYKDSCYFQSSVKKSWQLAENNCIQKGSHLVVVNNMAELVRQEHTQQHNYLSLL